MGQPRINQANGRVEGLSLGPLDYKSSNLTFYSASTSLNYLFIYPNNWICSRTAIELLNLNTVLCKSNANEFQQNSTNFDENKQYFEQNEISVNSK